MEASPRPGTAPTPPGAALELVRPGGLARDSDATPGTNPWVRTLHAYGPDVTEAFRYAPAFAALGAGRGGNAAVG
jgi:hypothetical protein